MSTEDWNDHLASAGWLLFLGLLIYVLLVEFMAL